MTVRVINHFAMRSKYGQMLGYLEIDDAQEKTPGSGDFRVLRYGMRNRSHLPCMITIHRINTPYPLPPQKNTQRAAPLAEGWRTLPSWVTWISDMPSLSAYHPWWEIEMHKIRIKATVLCTDVLVTA